MTLEHFGAVVDTADPFDYDVFVVITQLEDDCDIQVFHGLSAAMEYKEQMNERYSGCDCVVYTREFYDKANS